MEGLDGIENGLLPHSHNSPSKKDADEEWKGVSAEERATGKMDSCLCNLIVLGELQQTHSEQQPRRKDISREWERKARMSEVKLLCFG